MDDAERLQLRGANARAMGLSFLDNPFYKSEAMPGHTGENVSEWERKARAWSDGWELENAVRSPFPAQIPLMYREPKEAESDEDH